MHEAQTTKFQTENSYTGYGCSPLLGIDVEHPIVVLGL